VAYKPDIHLPPRRRNYRGEPRRVGVEIEFAALSVRESAPKVQALFGGTLREEDPHRFHILGTSLGDFTCELDTQYAHDTSGSRPDPASMGLIDRGIEKFQSKLRVLFGDISSLIMPCEVVSPPIVVADLPRLDALVEELAKAGGAGTRASLRYAFGAQLNPDIAEHSAEWITSVFKAYLLLSDWLRAVIAVDLTRKLSAYTDPFPASYVEQVLAPSYWPDLNKLMAHYIAANPTRNRELDMLPLFAWHDEAYVRANVPDRRVAKRPTFHYRLPDANVGQPGWSITLEWNRWCAVERLAENREALNAMGAAYLANREKLVPENWAVRASDWLVQL
jgi:hypothetical protein